jgi:serine/threonine-protein kinase
MAVQAVLSQVALALDRAHGQGLVHRDLKPGNLFITRGDDGQERIKLLDFGTAKLLRKEGDSDASQTRTGAMVGSPAYMSPEQLRGLRNIDPTTDIWALGVVAYECLIGQRPFTAPTIADLTVRICSDSPPVPSTAGTVPTGFDDWFAKACAHDPFRRFQRAGDLAQAFETLLTGPSATPPGPHPFDVTVELPPRAPAPRESSPPPLADSTGGVAHSQTVGPTRTRRSSLPWLIGLGTLIALGLGWIGVRTPDMEAGSRGPVPPSPSRRDAGSAAQSAVPDTGMANETRAPSPDTPSPPATGARKSPPRAGKPPRGGAKAVEDAPPSGNNTDKVYGF